MEIRGLAAVVTGGATGMGAAAAAALAAHGAKVTVLARRRDSVEAKAREIGGLGLACDITKPNEIAAAFDAAEAAHGPARICINSAAIGAMAPLLLPDGKPYPQHVLADIVTTNLIGAMYVAQAFAARLVEAPVLADGNRGVLINVSSISAADGMAGAAYVAGKAGVDALSLCLAREFAPWGIRSMTIAPGGVDTEMLRHNTDARLEAYIEKMFVHPRRLGRPAEFGALAMHIIQNDFLNGSVIRFAGGVHMPFIRGELDSTRNIAAVRLLGNAETGAPAA
jgi:NAD(P)-dependent dehydrogenase (short-subunit alcohol dehydrogenase family)